MNHDSKIYIAGHTGLVGSAITKVLKGKGYTNLITRTHAELELTNQQEVTNFFDQEKPEYVFMAAAKVGGIVANNTYRADFIYDNLMVQSNVIHQSYENNVNKLLFLGSTCVYPKNAPQPIVEDSLLTSPLEYTNEPYAVAKIAGIKMCESYNLQYGTNFLSVMPTNLYGPNDNFDLEKSHVLQALLRKMHLGEALGNNDWKTIKADLDKNPIENIDGNASNENILDVLSAHGIRVNNKKSPPSVQVEIWGTGKPKREFLWSEDLADACVYLMEHIDASSFEESGGVNRQHNSHINIGTGKDVSIYELAGMIKELVGFSGELFFNNEKPDGTLEKLTDVNRIQMLGWKHKIELHSGLQQMYGNYLEPTKRDQ